MGIKKRETHLSLAKITRPTYERGLPRKRLFRQIDLTRKKPVLWISGPAGSGKTMLVSSYIDDRALPCLWYQMDAGDADPSSFFYHLGHAVHQINRRKRKPMPLLTPEYMMGGVPVFSRRFFSETFSRMKAPSLVVFDNYHEVSLDSLLHDVISEGISHVPEHVLLIFVSREKPPAPFSRMIANDQMAQMDWDDLRLQPKEAEGITKLRGYDAKAAKALFEKTDGWIAGLILMLEDEMNRDMTSDSLDMLHMHEVFDYFAGEVFRKTDAATRMFLMKTSFLPHMTADIAEAVTGEKQGGRILSDLSRRNFFIMRKKQETAAYQYHPLFRHFLKDQAKRELNEEQVREVRRRSAAVLTERGQTEEAARLYIEAGQWEGLAGLIMRDAQSLLRQGRFSVLDGWIEALPRGMVEGSPWLLFFAGAAVFPRDPSASKALFEGAFHGFQEAGNAVGAFLSWSGVTEAIAFRAQELRELDEWVSVYSALVTRYGDILPQELKDRVTTAMYTAMVLRMLDHPEFTRWENEALKIIQGSRDIDVKVKLLFHHTLYLQDRGHFNEAWDSLNVFRDIIKDEDMTPLASLFYRMAAIHQANFTGQHDDCLSRVDEGLAFARNSGVHILDGPGIGAPGRS